MPATISRSSENTSLSTCCIFWVCQAEGGMSSSLWAHNSAERVMHSLSQSMFASVAKKALASR